MTDTAAAPARLPGGRLYDSGVVFLAGALMTIGITMVYSAMVSVSGPAFDWRHAWETPALKQGLFALAGFVVMLITAHIDYRIWAWERGRDAWKPILLLLLAFALVVAVLAIGRVAGGARRAIYLPGVPFGFQPSEFAKVVLVVWLASFLTRGPLNPSIPQSLNPSSRSRSRSRNPSIPESRTPFPDHVRSFWTGLLPAVITACLLIGPTAKEDFGTAALMGAIMGVILLCAGAKLWHLFLLAFPGVAAGALFVWIEPYRLERIQTWLSKTPDPMREGYQINQALLAIGSGGWWGRGLGAGVQKYGYLPQDNNDFILATICEELGVAGGIVVALLFLALLWRGWRIAYRAPDPFGRLLATGLTVLIALQAAFNIGVVTNSVPTKGISLPFVSAGGSGVVFLGFAAGLLAAVGRERKSSEERVARGG